MKRHLPHRITIERFSGDTADGPAWAAVVLAVPAYVEQKSKLVIDRRSSSSTSNQEVLTGNFVVLLTVDDVLPESYITVWAGTARRFCLPHSSPTPARPRTAKFLQIDGGRFYC